MLRRRTASLQPVWWSNKLISFAFMWELCVTACVVTDTCIASACILIFLGIRGAGIYMQQGSFCTLFAVFKWVFQCTRVCREVLSLASSPRGHYGAADAVSYVAGGEYWAIRGRSYHSYWTVSLIAVRVWVLQEGARGWEGNNAALGHGKLNTHTHTLSHVVSCWESLVTLVLILV